MLNPHFLPFFSVPLQQKPKADSMMSPPHTGHLPTIVFSFLSSIFKVHYFQVSSILQICSSSMQQFKDIKVGTAFHRYGFTAFLQVFPFVNEAFDYGLSGHYSRPAFGVQSIPQVLPGQCPDLPCQQPEVCIDGFEL